MSSLAGIELLAGAGADKINKGINLISRGKAIRVAIRF